MVKKGEKATIKEILEDYELPISIKKSEWFGGFYFVIERVDGETVYGTAYKNGFIRQKPNGKEYKYNINEKVKLFGENTLKRNVEEVELVSKITDDMYNEKATTISVKHKGKWEETEFKKFDKRKGKTVAVVNLDGEEKFYKYPGDYVDISFDGEKKEQEKNRQWVSSDTSTIDEFNKNPKSRPSSDDYDEELEYEETYHIKVNEKLDSLDKEARMMLHSNEITEKVFDGEWIFDAYNNYFQNVDSLGDVEYLNQTRLNKQCSDIVKAKKEPYIGRIDFGKNENDLHTVYLGYFDIKGYAVDWRNSKYASIWNNPEIYINSNNYVLGLKRIFDFNNTVLNSFTDEINLYNDIVPNYDNNISKLLGDSVLLSIMKSNRQNKEINDIVKTIQNKQYEIISSDFNNSILVNGCAGSGKTMIMYHRISYLAYNYADSFKNENVYAITPSTLFSSLFKKLTEDLRIPEINNLTYYKTVNKFIDKYALKNHLVVTDIEESKEDENTSMASGYLNVEKYAEFVNALNNISKHSEDFGNWFINYINNDLKENQINEISDAEFYKNLALNKDLGSLIDARIRTERFTLENSRTVKNKYGADEKVIEYKYIPRELASYSIKNVLYTVQDNESLKKRLNKYEGSMNLLLGSVVKKDKDGIARVQNKLMSSEKMFSASLTLLKTEKALRAFQRFFVEKEDSQIFLYMCKYACKVVFGKEYSSYAEKIYTLKALTSKFGDVFNEKALVFVDEFQNYSEFEINTLIEPFNNPIINLYGDFNQRLEEKGAGIEYYNQIIDIEQYEINENYRNAFEITQFINSKLNKTMLPIGIHGTVVEKTLSECEFKLDGRTAIISDLNPDLVERMIISNIKDDVQVSKEKDSFDENKINVLNVCDCKGLEFDTVYVLNMNMNKNEQYVAYTRALTNLIVINNNTSFDEQVKNVGLDVDENWKKDVRTNLVTMFEPMLKETNYYLEINTTDTTKQILDLYEKGKKERLMGIGANQNKNIKVFLNKEFYNLICGKYKLGENERPNKTQIYLTLSLPELWNVICVITSNDDNMV